MALCKVFLFIVGFSGLLIAISDAACTEADVIRCYGSVTLTAASYTDGSGSKSGSGSSDRDTQCENLRNDYDDCKAQYDTCENPSSSLTNAKDAAQVAYDNSYCSGGVQFLLSWSMYMAVMTLTFKHLLQ